MFAIRRTSRAGPNSFRLRGNATLQQTQAAVEAAVPPAPAEKAGSSSEPAAASPKESEEESQTKTRQGPHRFWPGIRPSISLERPRQYNRPIRVGVLPAYDHALAYIERDSVAMKEKLEGLKIKLEDATKTGKDGEEVERLQSLIEIVEVQSEINVPSVRWKARNGLADLSKPVYRHLLEQRWRNEGDLDLLMERIHQMNVVPDILPELHPSFYLRLNFPEAPPEDVRLRTRVKRKYEKIEPGSFLVPEQTRKPPMIYTSVFHTDTRLYTLIMIDGDAPDQENQRFQSYLHWLQPNISLSSASTAISLPTTHTKYIPPHPQKGTAYHRYVLLLVPQADNARIKVTEISDSERLGFDYRSFAETYGLDASKGGAAHMWREVWDESVSKIYKEVLQTEEPVFGRQPREDPYAEKKKERKYI